MTAGPDPLGLFLCVQLQINKVNSFENKIRLL